jgi:hypothetical protein
MGCGRALAFTANIFPFADNPTFALPVLFYSVPASNPDGPASPFPDRFWDNRENWIPPGVGTDPTSFKPYFGPRPAPTVGPLVGSLDEWAHGLSYAKWLTGGYSNPNGCVQLIDRVTVGKSRQVQTIQSIAPPSRGVNQGHQVLSGYAMGVAQTCCPPLLPPVLYLTIAGSGSSDGKYPLSFNPATSGWQTTNVVGACAAAGIKVSVGCDPATSTWSLVYRKTPPATGFNSVTGVVGTCSPLNVLFTGLVAWCGDSVPGTWTISQS